MAEHHQVRAGPENDWLGLRKDNLYKFEGLGVETVLWTRAAPQTDHWCNGILEGTEEVAGWLAIENAKVSAHHAKVERQSNRERQRWPLSRMVPRFGLRSGCGLITHYPALSVLLSCCLAAFLVPLARIDLERFFLCQHLKRGAQTLFAIVCYSLLVRVYLLSPLISCTCLYVCGHTRGALLVLVHIMLMRQEESVSSDGPRRHQRGTSF